MFSTIDSFLPCTYYNRAEFNRCAREWTQRHATWNREKCNILFNWYFLNVLIGTLLSLHVHRQWNISTTILKISNIFVIWSHYCAYFWVHSRAVRSNSALSRKKTPLKRVTAAIPFFVSLKRNWPLWSAGTNRLYYKNNTNTSNDKDGNNNNIINYYVMCNKTPLDRGTAAIPLLRLSHEKPPFY